MRYRNAVLLQYRVFVDLLHYGVDEFRRILELLKGVVGLEHPGIVLLQALVELSDIVHMFAVGFLLASRKLIKLR